MIWFTENWRKNCQPRPISSGRKSPLFRTDEGWFLRQGNNIPPAQGWVLRKWCSTKNEATGSWIGGKVVLECSSGWAEILWTHEQGQYCSNWQTSAALNYIEYPGIKVSWVWAQHGLIHCGMLRTPGVGRDDLCHCWIEHVVLWTKYFTGPSGLAHQVV